MKSELPNFNALQGGIFVAPILQKLILNRDPEKVLAFVDLICKWDFKRVIPCHLVNDIKTNPKELRDAFSFLEQLTPLQQLLLKKPLLPVIDTKRKRKMISSRVWRQSLLALLPIILKRLVQRKGK